RISPPPSSTLFPYTTLFRSGLEVDVLVEVGEGAGQIHGSSGREQGGGEGPYSGSVVLGDALLEGGVERREGSSRASGGKGDVDGDRKSTRLNSSHVAISYAV